MPLYEYQCKKCKHRFEKIQLFSDAPVKKCPECGGPVEKLISAPSVHFKGSGWYVTDYAKKSGGSGASNESKDSTPADSTAKSGDGAKSSDAAKADSSKSESSKSGGESKSGDTGQASRGAAKKSSTSKKK